MSNHNVYGQPPLPNVTPSSVISLVLGILGLVACLIPILGIMMTIPGLICGCFGVTKPPRGMAIAGIILNSIGFVLSVLLWIIGMAIMMAEL